MSFVGFQLSARVAAEAAPHRRSLSVQSLFNIQDERGGGVRGGNDGSRGRRASSMPLLSSSITGNKAPPPTAQDK